MPRLFGDTYASEVLLEGADLDGQETLAIEEGGGAPVLGLDAGEDAGVAGEPVGLRDAPWVADDDVLLLALADRRPAQHRVGVVGDEVAAAVVAVVRGVGPRDHGADGALVDAAGAHDSDEVAGVVLVGEVVVRLASVDLRHGLDRVAVVKLRDVDVLTAAAAAADALLVAVATSHPLGEGLLIKRWPERQPVARAAVHEVLAGVVHGDAEVDLDSLRLVVVAPALVVELDLEAALLLVLFVVGAGAKARLSVHPAVDDRRVGPVDGEKRGDEPAVRRGALDRVVELARALELARAAVAAIVEESVVVRDHASAHVVVAQQDDITSIAPRAVRGREILLVVVASERQSEVVDGLRHLAIGHRSSDLIGMQDEVELVVQDTCPLDTDIAHLLQADVFEIAELLKTAEVRSDQTTRIKASE